jgi:DtxR family transcriptional regulator, Mn-dependent transcriptional regulator
MSKNDYICPEKRYGMNRQLSQSEENYIKAIYALSESSESISTNLLAERINTKASSVTDMLKKLSEKGFLTYQKYQGCSLTPAGLSIALSIVRKHRLWEVFLVDTLQFGWDEVHEIAEQLEHIQSAQLTNRLEEFLGFPKVDPHGDPIPNREGEFETPTVRVNLASCEIGAKGIVMGVEDGSPEFLQYLNRISLKLGSEIEVIDKLTFDGSLVITIDHRTIQFSQVVATKIFVKVSVE